MRKDTIHGVALCAGVGGFELALRLIFGDRYKTELLVEREVYAVSALVARMEDKTLPPALIWDDITTFSGAELRGKVHIVTAGFPCQPFSLAGKRKGTDDERWIWVDVARIIREMGPEVVWLENVPGLALSNAIDANESGWFMASGLWHVLRDLAGMGFDAEWGMLPAAAVGTSHRRRRIYILAHARSQPGLPGSVKTRRTRSTARGHEKNSGSGIGSDELADSGRRRQHSQQQEPEPRRQDTSTAGDCNADVGNASSDDERRNTDREHGQGIATGRSSGNLAKPISGRRSGRTLEPERQPQGRDVTECAGEELDIAKGGGQPELREPSSRKRRRGHVDGTDQDVAIAAGKRKRSVSDRQGRRDTGHADRPGDAVEFANGPGRSSDCSESTIARGDGQNNGLSQPAGTSMAEPTSPGFEEPGSLRGNSGKEQPTIERSGIPLFPPGPGLFMPGVIDDIRELLATDPRGAWGSYCAELRNTVRWFDVLQIDPTLEPAIRRVANGYSSELDKLIQSARVDRIRAVGNAIVPAAAALMFLVLAERLGLQL